jgi:hypothetical protein
VERRAVQRFVEQALGDTRGDRVLGETLFEMLVPNDFKAYAPDRRKLVLIMDEQAAELPWELIQDRYQPEGRPLSVASGMVRQLLVRNVTPGAVVRAATNTALVIGDPIVSDPRFPALQGAADEADAVADRLEGEKYVVTRLMGALATPSAVFSTLLRGGDWRILHLAGHGVFEFVPEEGETAVSGLVLDDRQFLTADIAGQMRVVPELVFLNCCHLGYTGGDGSKRAFHRLAANLGTAFIRMGARAVIAAGWAVNDAAAKTFAYGFYDELFAGNAFGDAVLRARERTFAAHQDSNTWGAYQCYGDPSFSLVRPESRTTQAGPVAATEVVAWAEELMTRAQDADEEGSKKLQEQLAARLGTMPVGWLEQPRVCAAVAAAFGELGAYEQALGYYERLTRAEQADVALRALEQMVNLRVKSASAQEDPAEAKRLLDAADGLLQHLVAIGKTAERSSLRGGLEKRRAFFSTGKERAAALARMRDAYGDAFAIAETEHNADRAYALINRLTAEIALGWRRNGGRRRRRVVQGLSQLADLARELSQASTAFFDLLVDMDCLILNALATNRMPDAARDTIRNAYHKAAHRGVSPRQRNAVLQQLQFLAAMADPQDAPHLPAELQASLTRLYQELNRS